MANVVCVKIIAENCRGCRRCEAACSSYNPGPFNPRPAGIHIMKLDAGGTDYPVINVECLERFCGKTEPGKQDVLEPACVSACLFEALQMDRGEGGGA